MALDSETVEILEKLSTRWKSSKAEVLRRAVRKLDEDCQNSTEQKLQALKKLSQSGITKQQCQDFAAEVKAERMAEREPWDDHLKKIEEEGNNEDPL